MVQEKNKEKKRVVDVKAKAAGELKRDTHNFMDIIKDNKE